jgi:hypothetical protein
MTAKFVIALVVVILVLAGTLIGFLRTRVPLPPQDVLDRVKRRERELEAKEKLERGE